MPEITQEQLRQLMEDDQQMQKAGLSPDDRERYRASRLENMGVALPTERTTGQIGLAGAQKAALFAGPAIGGMYGASLTAGRNALPFMGGAGRAATQFLGEAVGIGVGDVAGRAAAGVEQRPMETLGTAAGGAALGSAFRGLVKTGAGVGNVPETVIQEAAVPVKAGRVPLPLPNLQRVSRAGPHVVADVKAGISPEMDLAERASKAARAAKRTLTTSRMEKELLIRQADATGVRIPVEPIKDALRDNLPMEEAVAHLSDARLLRNKINQTIAMLDEAAKGGGGTVTPGKIDKLIRKVLRPGIYKGTGRPSNTMYARALDDAENSATHLLNDALPGDIAAKNAAITKKLSETENAVLLFGDPDKAGVSNRLSNAFTRGNEMSARALTALSEHDASLVDDAAKLYSRRQFGGDIRQPIPGGESSRPGMLRRAASQATRVAAPFQRFVGGAGAGAYEAFVQAMNPLAPRDLQKPVPYK